jgi:hypothetical protein
VTRLVHADDIRPGMEVSYVPDVTPGVSQEDYKVVTLKTRWQNPDGSTVYTIYYHGGRMITKDNYFLLKEDGFQPPN